jgi:hypothetical protein
VVHGYLWNSLPKDIRKLQSFPLFKKAVDKYLPPQGFGPRGPKPEEAYIEVPARKMISIYIYGIYQRQRNLSF